MDGADRRGGREGGRKWEEDEKSHLKLLRHAVARRSSSPEVNLSGKTKAECRPDCSELNSAELKV